MFVKFRDRTGMDTLSFNYILDLTDALSEAGSDIQLLSRYYLFILLLYVFRMSHEVCALDIGTLDIRR